MPEMIPREYSDLELRENLHKAQTDRVVRSSLHEINIFAKNNSASLTLPLLSTDYQRAGQGMSYVADEFLDDSNPWPYDNAVEIAQDALDKLQEELSGYDVQTCKSVVDTAKFWTFRHEESGTKYFVEERHNPDSAPYKSHKMLPVKAKVTPQIPRLYERLLRENREKSLRHKLAAGLGRIASAFRSNPQNDLFSRSLSRQVIPKKWMR